MQNSKKVPPAKVQNFNENVIIFSEENHIEDWNSIFNGLNEMQNSALAELEHIQISQEFILADSFIKRLQRFVIEQFINQSNS